MTNEKKIDAVAVLLDRIAALEPLEQGDYAQGFNNCKVIALRAVGDADRAIATERASTQPAGEAVAVPVMEKYPHGWDGVDDTCRKWLMLQPNGTRLYATPISEATAPAAVVGDADALQKQVTAMKHAAMHAHTACYKAMLLHPEIETLADDGELHCAIHAIVGVETPSADDYHSTQQEAKAEQVGERYTCIGKGGDYVHVGVASGAGLLAGSLYHVYRDTLSGLLFARSPMDFHARMQAVSTGSCGCPCDPSGNDGFQCPCPKTGKLGCAPAATESQSNDPIGDMQAEARQAKFDDFVRAGREGRGEASAGACMNCGATTGVSCNDLGCGGLDAGNGEPEAIMLNGMPVERIQLDWVCSLLSSETIFNGSDLLQAFNKLVAFYVAHRAPAAPSGRTGQENLCEECGTDLNRGAHFPSCSKRTAPATTSSIGATDEFIMRLDAYQWNSIEAYIDGGTDKARKLRDEAKAALIKHIDTIIQGARK